MNGKSISIYATFLLDALLVGIAVFGSIALSNVSAVLALPPFFLWSLGIYLDFTSTHEIYKLNPTNFSSVELNKIFAGLVDRLGFSKGIVVQILFCEIPLFIFISLFLLWFIAPYLSFTPGLPARLGGSATGLAIAHITAWRMNRSFIEEREKT